ncbi:hypothetical protein EJ03DRAFT_325489 [Teratosphaeria nubilosa]|uniref:Uncharacterized protein n=1 Tax=Teratosphaeria nubilosa TaxID=161662 RepID=A0A6G1LEZ6_9PEZI|nr:hypothetical protein EJ03DRAFT_325489 [Teratosphaeria nubilosa]
MKSVITATTILLTALAPLARANRCWCPGFPKAGNEFPGFPGNLQPCATLDNGLHTTTDVCNIFKEQGLRVHIYARGGCSPYRCQEVEAPV